MTLLNVRDLTLSFGGVKAVNAISFDIQAGEIFTIIGPNGAGKTTLFNLLSRIYRPTGGEITFDGMNITNVAAHRIAKLGIARTFQNIELFEHASVLHNLLVGRQAHVETNVLQEMLFLPSVRKRELEHRDVAERVIELLRLEHARDELIANLPYGVRKIVEIARALCTQPKLLLLDEPSSGLNPEETHDIGFWIRDIRDDLGITIALVEHDMGLVGRVSDRVMAIDQGQMVAVGRPDEVRQNPQVLSAYLGIPS
ncbi:ABC transporter ATP-binding protein [Bradyrhizobium sp. 1]|uniref:ABC transporter ATP-binding protein n=1 Tax=Bradyrhizobium sp. 1 TaxID=241591 RepID=UPI001FF719E7|nr:ABC transporter ATP-binding protein [Bradyrhizobium sp. 1]MCK1394465.1 ABC transporter ATP-binding protein [Bradyrhizobium sp. 1]